MALALVSHVADRTDQLLLWLGVTGVPAVPALSWRVNGQPAAPRVVRPWKPVLSGTLAKGAQALVHAGFFELSGLAPGASFKVEVTAGADRIERILRTLPAAVPESLQGTFNVLLVSCFHQIEDQTGTAGRVLSGLNVKPHLTICAGDQVYLDLPTLTNFQADSAWLANKFQNDYLANWFGDRRPNTDPTAVPPGYAQVFALAPTAFMPDDHEYWNNYPFWSALIQNSWTASGRRSWKDAAETVYRGFQQTTAAGFGAARAIEIEPLSILILDTRSQRAMDSRVQPGDLLGAGGRQSVESWVDSLVRRASDPRPWFGMLVTGQSLFRSATGKIQGATADYELPDYDADFRFLVAQIERLTKAGLPLILATGDVHWGRVVRAVDPSVPGAPIFEVISSPTSLVSIAGYDQAKTLWGAVKSLFGASDPWPRHADPEPPPERFGSAGQYALRTMERASSKPAMMRGNQAFMLRFVRSGAGLDVDVVCYPLSGMPAFDTAEQWSTQLELRAPRSH